MILVSVHVQKFRHILDSTEVRIEPDVTCLVGKNESGKTAFLEALRRLNPAQEKAPFEILKHYPAWREKADRRKGNLDEVTPISATFELTGEDLAAIAKHFGPAAMRGNTLTVSKQYGGNRLFNFGFDEKVAAQYVWSSIGLTDAIRNRFAPSNKLEIQNAALALEGGDDEERLEAAKIREKLKRVPFSRERFMLDAINVLDELVPKFFYYASYSSLPSIVNIKELLSTDIDELDVDQRTARALLLQAGAEDDYLLNSDYQTRVRELENVANSVTQDILQYWSTNQNLRVKFDITQKTVSRQNGNHAVIDELHIRMDDSKHFLSLPFNERSSGFQWFFSFLSAFSEYEFTDDPVVILLDEPGVGLHARAQKDFLKFINERLSKRCQVIYTTHSPFMVEPSQLGRVRIVEDKGTERGSVVSDNIFSVEEDSLFPLQGALGYDLAQNLFISPNNLVIEGTSDYTYLSVISDLLKDRKRTYLDERWTLVPVGGADLVPTFVALLGAHLDVTVLVDARKEGHQKLSALAKERMLNDRRIITIGDILGRGAADIEDLFSPDDYLKIYNKAFRRKTKRSELTGSDPIVRQIARLLGLDRFDHGVPAAWFLKNREEILPELSDETLSNFEKLYDRVNGTLSK